MLKVYGLKVSYFTGKLEAYLRYKEIPYEFCPMTAREFMHTIPEKTGAMQMPAVELPDGRWMTDTSPMIDWFETQHPDPPILPEDPAQAFLCRLIEDFADEWLWRPAMHYRWSYPLSSKLLARQISDAMGRDIRAPGFLKRRRTEKRQKLNFVDRDGVTPETRAHVEGSYLRLLDMLESIFQARPFLLGDRPTLADIGLMGPLFRHFAMDPVPGILMRENASGVMAWVYRVWNARASSSGGDLVTGIPDDLLPLLREVAETHLEALNANALAWQAGNARHGMTIQKTAYRDIQTSQYRVWCLETLQARYRALDDATCEGLDSVLQSTGILEPLLRLLEVDSKCTYTDAAPFGKSFPVFAEIRN
ncbi:glutathione S-transferase family protein [uncultured Hyphomonas sp.]|uniref:glutathione S-transferase family protein n=1 Tax=uncultured Hyphomonas sp. TaxID=225298 RepID=UPI002AAB6503|nr:glutathione S-transferase family protein [uncultured Hyphomonas sp.]